MFTLLEGLKFGATSAMGIFAGGAAYINLVEHPSRRDLPVAALRQQWANSFDRGKLCLPSMGLIGAGCATAVYFLDESENRYYWLSGPALFITGGLFSAVAMLPDINILLDKEVVEKKGETWVRDAIDRWNSRHTFRTFLDCVAFFTFLYLSIKT